MQAFEYANPTTIAEAASLLAGSQGETQSLGGGTDLISLMKDEVVAPKRLVNLKSIEEMKGVEWREGDGLRVGAVSSLDDLAAHPEVAARYPALVQAIDGVRSPQIRAMGTVGGDLLQRPRCWYYRSGSGLLAQRDGESLIPDGDNRYHAVLGNAGPAYFVNPSSLAPALIALGARARVVSADGERELALGELYRTPRSEGEREVALEWSELLTEIAIPDPGGRANATYEVREREALDWPLAAAAAVIEMDGATVRSASVVLGHVAPTPYPSPAAAQALVGKAFDVAAAEAAGTAAVEGARALSGNAYKITLARVAVKRAVLRAGGMEV